MNQDTGEVTLQKAGTIHMRSCRIPRVYKNCPMAHSWWHGRGVILEEASSPTQAKTKEKGKEIRERWGGKMGCIPEASSPDSN